MICDTLDELHPAPESRRSQIAFVRDRRGHDRRYALDSGKIRDALGWQPAIPFESGLRETIRWYLDHREWIDSIRGKEPYRRWMEEHYPREKETG
jgi:dTDP-glucose 4,6-dehydratase